MNKLPESMYDYRAEGHGCGHEEDDRKVIGRCCECNDPLFEGDQAYYVKGSYWCLDCMENILEEL